MIRQAPTSGTITNSLATIQKVFTSYRSIVLTRAGNSDFVSKAGDGSPVTETDKEIELAVQAEMAKQFPELPVYGEETGYGGDMPAVFYLIDPIDGTTSFIKNIPAFTSMAVLIANGEAVAALIYNPSTDTQYTAVRGGGAFKNGRPIDLHTMPLASTALCKEELAGPVNTLLEPHHITCRQGPSGGGFGFTMVLDGLAAARFNIRGGGYTHDYAPGALLVHEAGGALIPLQQNEYTYESRSFVACHPALEATIRAHVTDLRQLEHAG